MHPENEINRLSLCEISQNYGPLLVMVVHDYLIGAPGVFFFSVIKQ